MTSPRATKAWKQGADGETRLGARLTKLLQDDGVNLLHDRRMPRHGGANIDRAGSLSPEQVESLWHHLGITLPPA
jgi:hypothetical protein